MGAETAGFARERGNNKGICLDFSKDADTFFKLKDWCTANLQGIDNETLQQGAPRLMNWGIKYHPSPHIEMACLKSGIMNESAGFTPEESRAYGRVL